MKKIFITFLLIFLLFSCSENFNSNIYKKVENKDYSYLIPKEWNFEEGKYSKIIETKISENESFLIKIISKSETGATFEEFEKLHKNKKGLKETLDLKIDNLEAKKFIYNKNNIGVTNEVVLASKGDKIFKIEIYYLDENKENIEKIFKSLNFK